MQWEYGLRHIGMILNQPNIGDLLKGMLKIAFIVETTLEVAFSSCPVLTVYDLKQALLKNKAITKESLDALGKLENHPMMQKNFQIAKLKTELLAYSRAMDVP